MTDAPVLIAGGGPVGMTLALVLAHYGVRSTVVERNPSTTRHPKMDLTNGRSMELFRRIGLVDKLRAAGVPEGNPFDIVWATSPAGHLLYRFAYPSAAQKRSEMDAANDGTGTREPGMRISQIILEPVLREAVEASPLIDSRFGWTFETLEQDGTGVSAAVREARSGERHKLRAGWLIGCDGGGSRVRRELGIALEGPQSVARGFLIHFTSEDREFLNPWGIAWHLQTPRGSLVAQDDRNTWTLHTALPPGTDEAKVDPGERLRAWAGRDFDFDILVANAWSPHLVIAERYLDGRVILAGDAAHQVIPTGGYGMNSGVGDAFDLGWKLAAIVNGWGGPKLLDSYERERRPIAVQNRAASERHFGVRIKLAEMFARFEAEGSLDETGPIGADRRSRVGAAIAALGNAENEFWGIEHGYRYGESPIVWQEAGTPPPFDPLTCAPTTWPGGRLPHLRLSDVRFLHDQLARDFTLLVAGGVDPGDVSAGADRLGIPLAVVRLGGDSKLGLLERNLLLVRPDQHIAWRGDAAPHDWDAVLKRIVGR
jgi:2-polyprenyl-6-methoxyphenol hydroxylase-like FAD-dependent oxidoreductase